MRVLTFRLMQFAVCSLCLTVAFHYALNLSLGKGSVLLPVLCAVAYFCLMFIAGLYFGSKDSSENEIHDIGFRYHLVTYLLCIGIGYAASYIGWCGVSLKSMNITALLWGVGLFIHFLFFVLQWKNTLRGYSKDEIFQ